MIRLRIFNKSIFLEVDIFNKSIFRSCMHYPKKIYGVIVVARDARLCLLDKTILDSKINACFSIFIEYQKTLSNFTLNDMNMFERTHAFAPGSFIRHYTVNYYVLLFNAKNAKTVP